MSTIRPPNNCGLFKTGHGVHWIQANLTVKDKVHEPVPGLFIQSRREGTVVIEVNGQELLLWNHESERIGEAIAAGGRSISYQARWGLWWVPSRGSRYAFCVALASRSHEPCPSQPPTGTPAELMKSAGGFTVSSDKLRG